MAVDGLEARTRRRYQRSPSDLLSDALEVFGRDPLYEAVVECTEEAIVNALCMAEEMRGQSGHVAPALPLDKLTEILRNYRKAFAR